MRGETGRWPHFSVSIAIGQVALEGGRALGALGQGPQKCGSFCETMGSARTSLEKTVADDKTAGRGVGGVPVG